MRAEAAATRGRAPPPPPPPAPPPPAPPGEPGLFWGTAEPLAAPSPQAQWVAAALARDLGDGDWRELAEALAAKGPDAMARSLAALSGDCAQAADTARAFARRFHL
jgi:hypothetical protein